MTPKKKRKTPAAQQLIDSLLDERTPTSGRSSSHHSTPLEFETDPGAHDFGAPAAAKKSSFSPADDEKTRVASSKEDQPKTISLSADVSSANLSLEEDDRTMQIPAKSRAPQESKGETASIADSLRSSPTETELKAEERARVDRAGLTELKTVVKMRDRFQDPRVGAGGRPASASGGGFNSSDAVLKQSENLRIAQARITELEQELERLRRDNEQLGAAGETLRRRSDELLTKAENLELQLRESERTHDEEKKVFRGQLQAKDREINEMRGRLEEMESRLESNFKKIRVRERELEHRLEIVRMESQTLVATKDKMILELKRQIDQITHENDYAKHKAQEHFNQYKEKQETIRRVVRALRIALTILEGDEDAGIKKSE